MEKADWQWLISVLVPIILYVVDNLRRNYANEKVRIKIYFFLNIKLIRVGDNNE